MLIASSNKNMVNVNMYKIKNWLTDGVLLAWHMVTSSCPHCVVSSVGVSVGVAPRC